MLWCTGVVFPFKTHEMLISLLENTIMSSIDPADFVQVEGDQVSLRFGDPRQQAKFELGVCMAIYKWEELTTAVENSWGGPNLADKRDWLLGVVIELFDEKAVDLVLIEETLLYAMVDEFDTEVDNDSALIISDLIMKIYRECAMQNYARVDDLYAKFQLRQQSGSQRNRVEIGEDPNNPDDSDDSDGDDEIEDGTPEPAHVTNDDMDIDQGPRQPIIDEDGFELVQRRRRR
ncbi:pre-rRNA-processing protein TSR2 [Metschnikowia aff. pulcherrima]|uniref:Pre-rRNA-processing protein TSR2 n=2 Tax=Metschnikowia TaxID=27320 RepID=A0A4P6XRX2_9ASCO|nr:pre-rRNA-processing protein TSR2 [Metschnikowia aff. pulcherrima]